MTMTIKKEKPQFNLDHLRIDQGGFDDLVNQWEMKRKENIWKRLASDIAQLNQQHAWKGIYRAQGVVS